MKKIYQRLLYQVILPEDYVLRRSGIYERTKNGLEQITTTPIVYAAEIRDADSQNWKALLRGINLDGNLQEWAVDKSLLYDPQFVKSLMRQGFKLVFGYGKAFMQYINSFTPTARYRLAHNTGWFNGHFVLPNEVIPKPEQAEEEGEAPEEIIFTAEGLPAIKESMTKAGTFEDWQESVASNALGNDLIIFALCVGFASPLLNITGHETGGFHIYGPSSQGKTTLLQVAASVWGNGSAPSNSRISSYIDTWRVTANALEAMAAAHNDILLLLDEIHQIDSNALGKVVYDLASGTGKSRMSQDATLRTKRTWRVLYLSTGEISARSKMAEDGKPIKTGQIIRLVDIHIHNGIVHNTHGLSAAQFVDNLKKCCSEHYGWAGPKFIEYLQTWIHDDDAAEIIEGYVEEYTELLIGDQQYEPEQVRALKRIAFVAAAGELAVVGEVLPLDVEDIRAAAVTVAQLWLSENRFISDAVRAVKSIRDFIQTNPGRFASIDARNTLKQSAGYVVYYRNDIKLYLFHEDGFEEACGGVPFKVVCDELKRRGLLHQNNSGKNKSRFLIHGFDRKQAFYAVRKDILNQVFSDDDGYDM